MQKENWVDLWITVLLVLVVISIGCGEDPSTEYYEAKAAISGDSIGRVGEPLTMTATTHSTNLGWTLLKRPEESLLDIGTNTTDTLSFTPDKVGTYEFDVTAEAQEGHEDMPPVRANDTHLVEVKASHPPTVNAGEDREVSGHPRVGFAGAVNNPDGDTLIYAWTVEQSDCGELTLEEADTLAPSVVLPDNAELSCRFTAKLAVTGSLGTETSKVTLTVVENTPPQVTVTPDTILAPVGDFALVEHTVADSDGDDLTVIHKLTFPDGTVSRDENWTPDPNGYAFELTEPGTYTDSLRAEDAIAAVEATASITATYFPVIDTLTAGAGLDSPVMTGTGIHLSAAASDLDDETLAFSWTIDQQPEGGAAEFNDAESAAPIFTPEVAGEYIVRLTVTDPHGATATDTLVLSATDEAILQFMDVHGPAEIATNVSYPYQAIGYYSDGTTLDLTQQVDWHMTDLTGAPLEGEAYVTNEPDFKGEVYAMEAGEYILVATDPDTAISGQLSLIVDPGF